MQAIIFQSVYLMSLPIHLDSFYMGFFGCSFYLEIFLFLSFFVFTDSRWAMFYYILSLVGLKVVHPISSILVVALIF